MLTKPATGPASHGPAGPAPGHAAQPSWHHSGLVKGIGTTRWHLPQLVLLALHELTGRATEMRLSGNISRRRPWQRYGHLRAPGFTLKRQLSSGPRWEECHAKPHRQCGPAGSARTTGRGETSGHPAVTLHHMTLWQARDLMSSTETSFAAVSSCISPLAGIFAFSRSAGCLSGPGRPWRWATSLPSSTSPGCPAAIRWPARSGRVSRSRRWPLCRSSHTRGPAPSPSPRPAAAGRPQELRDVPAAGRRRNATQYRPGDRRHRTRMVVWTSGLTGPP